MAKTKTNQVTAQGAYLDKFLMAYEDFRDIVSFTIGHMLIVTHGKTDRAMSLSEMAEQIKQEVFERAGEEKSNQWERDKIILYKQLYKIAVSADEQYKAASKKVGRRKTWSRKELPHRRSIMRKTKAKGVAELVQLALRSGLC